MTDAAAARSALIHDFVIRIVAKAQMMRIVVDWIVSGPENGNVEDANASEVFMDMVEARAAHQVKHSIMLNLVEIFTLYSSYAASKLRKKENEPPIRLLDDLFRKTKGTPCIYWLPLTPEAVNIPNKLFFNYINSCMLL